MKGYLIFFLILFIFLFRKKIINSIKDYKYILFFRGDIWKNCINQNPITPCFSKPEKKICFLTFETRMNSYIDFHNKNLEWYCDLHSHGSKKYNYFFYRECIFNNHVHNPYWCKLYICYEFLLTTNYDYIIWLDSDTVLSKQDILPWLDGFNSSIFVGIDILSNMNTLNAGVIIFKNNSTSRNILRDILNEYEDNQYRCVSKEGKLNGIWAMTCYEQGVMNYVFNRNKKDITILPEWIIFNANNWSGIETIIFHNCGEKEEKRLENFKKFTELYC